MVTGRMGSFSDKDVSIFSRITVVRLSYTRGNLEWQEVPITLEVMHRSQYLLKCLPIIFIGFYVFLLRSFEFVM